MTVMSDVGLILTCLDDDHALTVAKHLREDLHVEAEGCVTAYAARAVGGRPNQ